MRRKQLLTLIGSIALLSAASLQAQVPNIPAPILTAKTIFLGNGGTNADGDSERAFVDFYQQLIAWNHYRVVTNPADADLAAEISVNYLVSPTSRGEAGKFYCIRLTIRDEKTQTLLWSFTEEAMGSSRRNKLISNFEYAIQSLASDLKSLASNTLPPMQGDKPTAATKKK